ncbi:hypothetical protein NW754_002392 [Fusarium falciforme]|uniref:Uncharacterized protein n=1 Tax=Fusarium falciforme TaxID=195108 RepID=A0A9W8UX64_9HYPO|nr:hypothetical protein NW754_002392 [Fusarium falciforme]KAJ4180438.1 hypothetical protein NW755_011735 [Fusarium falciforme]KAJ4196272.1 hypothetical protein NW767_009390 [Fusarium falciforme]KAJ4240390.1 hypothetical protein NW757_012460 [Fusarium falciforme]
MKWSAAFALLIAIRGSLALPQTRFRGANPNSADNTNDNNNNNNNGNVASFEGQACTDGTFDGFCDDTGRCGLNIPPNEFSRQFVADQCGFDNSETEEAFRDFFGGNNGNDDNNDDGGNGNPADFEGQACTDGTFDGVCDDTGRCGLEIPPNELSRQFVAGQCGS